MSGGTLEENPGLAPDGGWGWIIVFCSFMIHFIMDGITYAMGDVYMQPMKERLNLGREYISAIFSILPAITLFVGPIATIFTNRFGCRMITVIGAFIAAFGFFLSFWIASIWWYYITIGIIGGFGFGMIYLPAIVSVGYYFEKKRATAMGIAVCGSGVGTMVFPFLMPYITGWPVYFGYEGGLLIQSSIIFMCILFGLLMIPLPHEPSEILRLKKKSLSGNNKNYELVNINEHNHLQPILEVPERLSSQDAGVVPIRPIESATNNYEETSTPRGMIQSNPKRNSSMPLLLVNGDDSVQPFLNNKQKPWTRSLHHLTTQSSDHHHPVLSFKQFPRKDVLYMGSLKNIPMFVKQPDEYHRQIIVDTQQSSDEDPVTLSTTTAKKTESIWTRFIDLSLLGNIVFSIFAVSNFLTSLGFNVPYTFAGDLAMDLHVPESQKHYIVMSMGIGNTIGRIVIGFLADKKINRLALYNITLIIAGIATMVAPLAGPYLALHIGYASVFGFFSGGYVGLTSIIVVDLVGLEKLSDAFGVLLLFQGVAVAIGSPIVGALRELLGNYKIPYLLFGLFITVSGAMLFSIPPLMKRRQKSKHKVTQHDLDMGVVVYSEQNLTQTT